MQLNIIKAGIIVLLATLLSTQVYAADEEDHLDTSTIDKELTGAGGILDRFFKRDDKPTASTAEPIESEVEIRIQEKDRADVSENVAIVRVIDKTLGKLYLIDLEVGAKKTINEITIKAGACFRPNQKLISPEGRALIEVYETRSRVIERIFNGWIYAQSASVSQLSHPKYDITLAGCKAAQIASAEVAAPETKVN